MPERFPPIAPVRARGAFASHEGARRAYDDQRVVFTADAGAAFAMAIRGMAHARSGRPAANRVGDLATRIFGERTSSMLDDLAEVWWRAEHGADQGARVRPFASLPIADRPELRARVRKLLDDRVPDALGDQAVLEAETKRLLDLPAAALRRAGGELERMAERDRTWVGTGACAVAAIFAAGQASIAHIGDGRIARLRRGKLERLTREHTLAHLYEDKGEVPDSAVVRDIVVRVLGMPGDAAQLDMLTVPLETRDVFILMTAGFTQTFHDDEIRTALLGHGVEAAPRLVADATPRAETNIAAVAVEIL